MSIRVYYNEWDRKKAAWLRELMKVDVISKGDVDERSITDVSPKDLRGYRRCHFFSGIGIWDYALGLAGWPKDAEVWTGSCPCQPFSTAGKGEAFNDPRHLWPALSKLIQARRPLVCFGEQVASIDGLAWLDAVQADLDAALYTCGAVDLCAAGFGAPHRRQRLYWVADSNGRGSQERRSDSNGSAPRRRLENLRSETPELSYIGGLADASIVGHDGRRPSEARGRESESERLLDAGGLELSARERCGETREDCGGSAQRAGERCGSRRGGNPGGEGLPPCERETLQREGRRSEGRTATEPSEAPVLMASKSRRSGHCKNPEHGAAVTSAGGFWSEASWVLTRPQRVGDRPGLRPTQPGTFPLVDGATARVGRLRGYGDGIVAPQAAAFVRAYMSVSGMIDDA